jgi:hypothetical protein
MGAGVITGIEVIVALAAMEHEDMRKVGIAVMPLAHSTQVL